MESIFDYYKEALRGVMRLCDIWVSYPANAMIGAMKQAGFGKKLIAETVESFRAAAGENPCSAYEVYCGICEAISIARQQGTNEKGLLALEEKPCAYPSAGMTLIFQERLNIKTFAKAGTPVFFI